jgi:hypothetical protein
MKSLTLVAVDSELKSLLDRSIANTNDAIEAAQRLAKMCEKLEQENQRLRKENTDMYLALREAHHV